MRPVIMRYVTTLSGERLQAIYGGRANQVLLLYGGRRVNPAGPSRRPFIGHDGVHGIPPRSADGRLLALQRASARRALDSYNRHPLRHTDRCPTMYTLARQLLRFKLSPKTLPRTVHRPDRGRPPGLNRLLTPVASLPVSVLGLEFPSPVGLARGLDKNGDAPSTGSASSVSASSRSAPSLRDRSRAIPGRACSACRKPTRSSIAWVSATTASTTCWRGCAAKYRGVLGINIGKNFDTPVERAVDDYLICLDKVYADASYVTVNVSSPNTPGLRSLQFGDSLKQLLEALRQRQEALALRHGRRVPLAIKIAPDMTDEETALVAAALVEAGWTR